MGNITACGSLFLKDTDFKVINNIITDATALTISSPVNSSCGLSFDSHFYKILNNDTLQQQSFITIIGVNNASTLTDSPCGGTKFDSAYFTLTNNVLSYGSAMNTTLTFITTPSDVTIELTDNLGNNVAVSNKIANVVMGRTYHYKVSKVGYKDAIGEVAIIQSNQTETITLDAETP